MTLERKRLTVDFKASVANGLAELAKKDGESVAAELQEAAGFYLLARDHLKNGGKLILEDPNGNRTNVILYLAALEALSNPSQGE